MLHLVFVDDHTEFSQEATGKTGAAQRREQLSDGLLGSFPHTPAATQQNGDHGMVIHPAERRQRRTPSSTITSVSAAPE